MLLLSLEKPGRFEPRSVSAALPPYPSPSPCTPKHATSQFLAHHARRLISPFPPLKGKQSWTTVSLGRCPSSGVTEACSWSGWAGDGVHGTCMFRAGGHRDSTSGRREACSSLASVRAAWRSWPRRTSRSSSSSPQTSVTEFHGKRLKEEVAGIIPPGRPLHPDVQTSCGQSVEPEGMNQRLKPNPTKTAPVAAALGPAGFWPAWTSGRLSAAALRHVPALSKGGSGPEAKRKLSAFRFESDALEAAGFAILIAQGLGFPRY